MLIVMCRTLNTKPLTRCRLKGGNNVPRKITLISPHNLMFHSNPTQADVMLGLPSFKKRGNENYVVLHMTLKRNARRIYETFYSHFLSDHYNVERRSSCMLKDTEIGDLIIFHLKIYCKK